MQEILSAVDAELFGVWFLIGAALVFWMQAVSIFYAGWFRNIGIRSYKSKKCR